MDADRLQTQIEQADKAFHRFWRGIMLGSAKSASSTLKKLGFLDMQLLSISCHKPGAILKEIREHLGVPQTTLSSVIARLEKAGLLRRVINHRDMRSFSLEITDAGRKVLEEHKEKDFEQAKDILELLDENERDEFIRLLTKVSLKMGRDFT